MVPVITFDPDQYQYSITHHLEWVERMKLCRICRGKHLPMNHFHGAKSPVLIHNTP